MGARKEGKSCDATETSCHKTVKFSWFVIYWLSGCEASVLDAVGVESVK